MTPTEQAAKLAQIRKLESTDEIKGWRLAIKLTGREPFEGELAALAEREGQLKGARA